MNISFISATLSLSILFQPAPVHAQEEKCGSVEYSLDQQALSVIERSPDWIPAAEKGRKERSWKGQPVIYRM